MASLDSNEKIKILEEAMPKSLKAAKKKQGSLSPLRLSKSKTFYYKRQKMNE